MSLLANLQGGKPHLASHPEFYTDAVIGAQFSRVTSHVRVEFGRLPPC